MSVFAQSCIGVLRVINQQGESSHNKGQCDADPSTAVGEDHTDRRRADQERGQTQASQGPRENCFIPQRQAEQEGAPGQAPAGNQ